MEKRKWFGKKIVQSQYEQLRWSCGNDNPNWNGQKIQRTGNCKQTI